MQNVILKYLTFLNVQTIIKTRMKYQSDIKLAVENRKINDKTLQRLKKKKPKFIDDLFLDLHNKAFNKIDC